MNYTTGTIDVFFTGVNFLSKVVVSPNISTISTFSYSGPTNQQISISNLSPTFTFPTSILSWGKNYLVSSTPTSSRCVGLFNQSSCRFDYDTIDNGKITFSNANTTNLGCVGTASLPSTETLVATIHITFPIH